MFGYEVVGLSVDGVINSGGLRTFARNSKAFWNSPFRRLRSALQSQALAWQEGVSGPSHGELNEISGY